MRAILKSGESIECDSYNIKEQGVELYDKSDGVEDLGYIPHDLLHAIIPRDFELSMEGDESESKEGPAAYTL
ncbi:hypothetical protein [Natrialba aegyptia]|uniref:Uncharacterized protein n=1 Tax=Natrialba aegyptia DSM 13077 TaxID=1227491 RepID=M0B7X9_9EURY|nr:hypothetical protein [Natrialba aegyptia]ELZ05754.1 hypothetical protein C480_10165 [Natrialba aegyptia DSM 13077]